MIATLFKWVSTTGNAIWGLMQTVIARNEKKAEATISGVHCAHCKAIQKGQQVKTSRLAQPFSNKPYAINPELIPKKTEAAITGGRTKNGIAKITAGKGYGA
jgi:hypothetical protein